MKLLPIDLKPFDEVIINQGILVGQTGTITRILKNSAEVVLESLGYKLVASFQKKNLVPLHKAGFKSR